MDIEIIESKEVINLNNVWLSGFTDAEGCFTCSVLISKDNKTNNSYCKICCISERW